MTFELDVTIALVVLEVAILLFCRYQMKRPVNPAKPRMIPYNIIFIVFALALLATLAHLISLLTGHQVQPRRRQGL